MVGRRPRTERFRLPPGEWARQHIVQMVTLGVMTVLLFACCNPPAWPTLVWQVVGAECGTVQWSGTAGGVTSSGATHAELCFAQAYQRCTAATLTASFLNLDNSSHYTFVIEPYRFTCALGALWNASGTFPFSGGTGFSYCDSIRLEATGLRVLGCQRIGDVFVPGDA